MIIERGMVIGHDYWARHDYRAWHDYRVQHLSQSEVSVTMLASPRVVSDLLGDWQVHPSHPSLCY
jgi:hypothetical protein